MKSHALFTTAIKTGVLEPKHELHEGEGSSENV